MMGLLCVDIGVFYQIQLLLVYTCLRDFMLYPFNTVSFSLIGFLKSLYLRKFKSSL